MKELLQFVISLLPEISDLYASAQGPPDPEAEKQIAARILRKASDERARREILGSRE